MPAHSGGPLDLVRQLKLKACRTLELEELLETFWPEQPRTERFQPEPGCSEPTFVGSDADISALSARMLNAVTSALQDTAATGHGWLLRTTGPLHGYTFPPDTVIATDESSLEVRVSSPALKDMCGWAHTSLRRHGPRTGDWRARFRRTQSSGRRCSGCLKSRGHHPIATLPSIISPVVLLECRRRMKRNGDVSAVL